MSVNHVNGNNPSAISTLTPETKEGGKLERVAPQHASSHYAKQAHGRPTISDAANVQISQRARELSQARKAVEDAPDIREDKVAHFKKLIGSGEYRPESNRIADGILHEAIRDELANHPESTVEE